MQPLVDTTSDFLERHYPQARARFEALYGPLDCSFRLEETETLPWYVGAVTLIDETPPIVQVPPLKRQLFLKKWGYDMEELLAHELVHVARASMATSRYEEHLAYATSKHWHRRWMGPWIHSLLHSAVGRSCFWLSFSLFAVSLCYPLAQIPAWGLLLATAAFSLWEARTLRSCWDRLKMQDPQSAGATLLRMEDRQIEARAP